MKNSTKDKSLKREVFNRSFYVSNEDYFDNKSMSSQKTAFLLKGLNQDNITNKVEINYTADDNYKACLYTFLSTFLYSITSFLGEVLSKYYPDVEASSTNFIRGIVLIFLSLFYSHKNKINLSQQINKLKDKIFVFTLRCLASALCNYLFFESLKYMRMSSSFTILNLSPIFTTILTVIFLNAVLLKIDIIALLVCFFSVILITKPAFIFSSSSSGEDHPLGIFLAFSAAVIAGISNFANKIIAKDFDTCFICLGIGIASSLLSLIISPFTTNGFGTLSFETFIIAIILSLFSFYSVFTWVFSISCGDIVKILPITYVGIVLNLIYSTFIFRQSCDFLDILGSCLIIFINIYKNMNH